MPQENVGPRICASTVQRLGSILLGGANLTLGPPMEAPEVESSVNRLCFVCASRIDYSENLCLTGSVSGEGPSWGGQLHASPPHDGTWGRDPHESFVLRLCLTNIGTFRFVPRFLGR